MMQGKAGCGVSYEEEGEGDLEGVAIVLQLHCSGG